MQLLLAVGIHCPGYSAEADAQLSCKAIPTWVASPVMQISPLKCFWASSFSMGNALLVNFSKACVSSAGFVIPNSFLTLHRYSAMP